LISRFLKKLLTFEIMPLNMEPIAEEVKLMNPSEEKLRIATSMEGNSLNNSFSTTSE
jgi:hypothetical protein